MPRQSVKKKPFGTKPLKASKGPVTYVIAMRSAKPRLSGSKRQNELPPHGTPLQLTESMRRLHSSASELWNWRWLGSALKKGLFGPRSMARFYSGIMAFVVAGAAAFPRLGVDRFPNMDLATINVRTNYPGAAAAEVESEVSQPLEDAVATVAGIEELRSISSDGMSLLLVTFNMSRGLDAAAQDVRDAIAGVLNRLPPDIDPPVVQKQDTDSSPIMTLAVSGPRSSRELYILADRFVKHVIES